MQKPVVVDADGHVVEPPEMLAQYIEPAFRDRIPKYVKDEKTGHEYWEPRDPTVSSTPGWFPQERMFITCAPNNAGRPWSLAGGAYRDGLPGAWDPHARIRDMDAEAIDIAVLYPTYALGFVGDAPLQSAVYRAYNGWLADYCKAYPKRLYGVAAVALQDVDGAARELRRCVKEYNFRGAFIRPNPYIGQKKLNDPVYDPFWRTAEELDVGVGLHPYLMADMPGAVRGLGLEQRDDIFFKQALGNPVDMMSALVAFTAGGVFERFSRLRVAFLEANGGWIVPMLERLDHHFDVWREQVSYLKHKPTELFQRQGYISFDADEKLLAVTARFLGADRIIWASDYPHPDAKMPGVVKELEESLEPLPERDRKIILGKSAADLYRIAL